MGDMENEEIMWKQIYTKLNSQKSVTQNEEQNEHDIR